MTVYILETTINWRIISILCFGVKTLFLCHWQKREDKFLKPKILAFSTQYDIQSEPDSTHKYKVV